MPRPYAQSKQSVLSPDASSEMLSALLYGKVPQREKRERREKSFLPDDHWAADRIDKPLHERFESVIVPMSAQEWARRYADVLDELEELGRRSPFPQLEFSAITMRDTLTSYHLCNRPFEDLKTDE